MKTNKPNRKNNTTTNTSKRRSSRSGRPSQKRGGNNKRKRSNNRHRNNKRPTPKTSPYAPPKKASTEAAHIPPLADGDIRVIFLGGVEEIGRNMLAIEYKDTIVVVDAGFAFSDDNTPGIDYLLPNIKYLEENREKVKALVITHGHLDHIGGIPFMIERIGNPKIYCRQFAALLIKKRQTEFPHLPELNIHIAEPDDAPISITDELRVEFFGLTHSIPDSTGIILNTPHGDIVNTGDVRVDNIDGTPMDKEYEQYAQFQDRNVLLFTMDSTGIADPGWSLSEETVISTIDDIVKHADGRIIIGTFASQVERVMAFIEMAHKYNKKVVVEGRSMKTNVSIVEELNLMDLSNIIPVDEIENYPDNKIMVLATGAQGEEFAALMRMSNNTHRQIKLKENDTVVLSSSIIPGNEGNVTKLKDNLYRHDAHVITYLDSQVHASGHGRRGELEWVHNQIPYRYFIPVHGYHHMIKMHAELAHSLGTQKDHIIAPENGTMVEIRDAGKTITTLDTKAPSYSMMVDGFDMGGIQEVVIRDRKMLAEDGIFMIVAMVDNNSGKLKKSPDIISRGFVYLKESQDLLQQTRLIIKRTVESEAKEMKPINFDYIKKDLVDNVSRYLFQQTAKRPLVIPVVLGV